MIRSLAIALIEFAVGLVLLYRAFQVHGYLEGPLTYYGFLVVLAAVTGFVLVHDAAHRFRGAVASSTSEYNTETQP